MKRNFLLVQKPQNYFPHALLFLNFFWRGGGGQEQNVNRSIIQIYKRYEMALLRFEVKKHES